MQCPPEQSGLTGVERKDKLSVAQTDQRCFGKKVAPLRLMTAGRAGSARTETMKTCSRTK